MDLYGSESVKTSETKVDYKFKRSYHHTPVLDTRAIQSSNFTPVKKYPKGARYVLDLFYADRVLPNIGMLLYSIAVMRALADHVV